MVFLILIDNEGMKMFFFPLVQCELSTSFVSWLVFSSFASLLWSKTLTWLNYTSTMTRSFNYDFKNHSFYSHKFSFCSVDHFSIHFFVPFFVLFLFLYYFLRKWIVFFFFLWVRKFSMNVNGNLKNFLYARRI